MRPITSQSRPKSPANPRARAAGILIIYTAPEISIDYTYLWAGVATTGTFFPYLQLSIRPSSGCGLGKGPGLDRPVFTQLQEGIGTKFFIEVAGGAPDGCSDTPVKIQGGPGTLPFLLIIAPLTGVQRVAGEIIGEYPTKWDFGCLIITCLISNLFPNSATWSTFTLRRIDLVTLDP